MTMSWCWPLVLYMTVLYVIHQAIRYCFYDSAPVRLIFQKSARNERLLKYMSKIPGRFYPTPYLVWDVLQTFYVILGRGVPPDPCYHEMLDVEPGEKIMLTWLEREDNSEGDPTLPIVIVLHGINGNASAAYTRHMARVMRDRGWRAVLPTRRGCNPAIPNQRTYEYRDPDFCVVVQYIAQKFPKAPLYAVGMSAGANIVTKYAGRTGKDCLLSGVVSIANGFDWDKGSSLLDRTWFWNRAIMHTCRKQFYYANIKLYTDPSSPLNGVVCSTAIRKSSGFRAFDEAFHVPLHQYSSIEEYYAAQSCQPDLPGIAVPILFIQSEDDPISRSCLIPVRTLYDNPNCMLVISNRGGHVGWAQGWFPFGVKATNWAEEVTVDYLQALMKESKGNKQL